jgi:anti-sigma B factor antagonist
VVSADEPKTTVKPLVTPEIVALPREVDASDAPRIGRDLVCAFGKRATAVIADMSLTEFCDSAGARSLLGASDAAKAWGGELRVVVRSPGVLRVMEIMGVDQALDIYSSLGEALAGEPHFEG